MLSNFRSAVRNTSLAGAVVGASLLGAASQASAQRVVYGADMLYETNRGGQQKTTRSIYGPRDPAGHPYAFQFKGEQGRKGKRSRRP
jgi:hypothetical protein